MATTSTPVIAAPKGPSFLKSFGTKFKAVFAWLGTPKAQAGIVAGEALGEGVVDAFNPALAALNPLINNWTQEIFKAESLAAAAGVQDGTGEQKAAMVLGSMTPQVVQFAEQNGLSVPIGADLTLANSLLVQFLNVFQAAPVAAPAVKVA